MLIVSSKSFGRIFKAHTQAGTASQVDEVVLRHDIDSERLRCFLHNLFAANRGTLLCTCMEAGRQRVLKIWENLEICNKKHQGTKQQRFTEFAEVTAGGDLGWQW